MRVRRIEGLAFALFLLLIATSCGRQGSSGSLEAQRKPAPASAAPQGAITLASQRQAAETARRIRTATLSLEVADLASCEKEVPSRLERLGGYIQDSRASGEGVVRRTSYVLRVPADRFDDAVQDLAGLGQVLESSTQTDDVTEAYADLEMRVRVKKGVEERLRGILDEGTGKLSEVLEVENELARVVEEVERLETALQAYDRQIAWSSLKLELRQASPIVQAGFWDKVSGAFHGGMATFTAAISAVVYLVTFLAPWLLAGALVMWLVVRLRGRRRGESVA